MLTWTSRIRRRSDRNCLATQPHIVYRRACDQELWTLTISQSHGSALSLNFTIVNNQKPQLIDVQKLINSSTQSLADGLIAVKTVVGVPVLALEQRQSRLHCGGISTRLPVSLQLEERKTSREQSQDLLVPRAASMYFDSGKGLQVAFVSSNPCGNLFF